MRKSPSLIQHWAPLRGSSYVRSAKPDPRTGLPTLEVDPKKKFITPYTLVSEPEEITVPPAELMCPGVFAGGIVANPVIFPLEDKGQFEIFYSAFSARFAGGPDAGLPTDQFMAVIFDTDVEEREPLLMNREVHARTLGGGFGDPLGAGVETAIQSAAGRPLVWPESFFLDPSRGGKALFMGYRNLTTFPIIVRWAFHGVMYYKDGEYEARLSEKSEMYGMNKVVMPYFYTTDTNVRLAAGETFDFDLRITDEADVEIFKLNKFSDFDFKWRFQEKHGKRYLDNAGLAAGGGPGGVHSDFGWGNAEFPFIPFETLYFDRNSKLKIQFSNVLTDQMNRIFPTLVCRKIEDSK
jgi:hypothetical protein